VTQYFTGFAKYFSGFSNNCLHSNTDDQSLGINSELYCYTEIKRRNKTPTP